MTKFFKFKKLLVSLIIIILLAILRPSGSNIFDYMWKDRDTTVSQRLIESDSQKLHNWLIFSVVTIENKDGSKGIVLGALKKLFIYIPMF